MKNVNFFLVALSLVVTSIVNAKNQKNRSNLAADSVFQNPDSLFASPGISVIIKESDFNKGFITSPFELIQGKVPGLNLSSSSGRPGTSFTCYYMGINSFMSNQPLVMIDQIPQYFSDFTLNPNDIESIGFLTDGFLTGAGSLKSANGVIAITTKKGSDNLKVDYSSNVAVSFLPKKADVLSASEFRNIINAHYQSQPGVLALMGDSETDWQEVIYQKAFAQEHQISLSGTVKMIALPFRFSVDDVRQEGILKTSNYRRSGARLSLHPSFFKNHLKISVNSQLNWFDNRIANESAIPNALRFDPTQPVYETNNFGNYFTYLFDADNPLWGTLENPLALLEQTQNTEKTNYWSEDIRVDYQFHFLPELRFVFLQNKQHYFIERIEKASSNSSWIYPLGEEQLNERQFLFEKSYYEAFLSFDKRFRAIQSNLEIQLGYNDYLVNNDNLYEKYFRSFYLNTSFNIRKTLNLNLNVVRQVNGLLSIDNRTAWFPGVDLAWKIKNSPFLKHVDVVSDLILFTGYSIVGTHTSFDENIGNLHSLDMNIHHEKLNVLHAGVKMGLLKNRVSGSLEFYNKAGKDLMALVYVPSGTNFNNYLLTNIGELTNQGFNLSLNALLIHNNEWRWIFNGNLNFNKSTLDKLYEMDSSQTGTIVGGVGNTIMIQSEGNPINQFYAYKQVYNSDGTPIENFYVDSNNDGSVNEHDRVIGKKATPDWIMGISSQLNYKNWELSFSGRFIAGHSIYNNLASVSYYHSFYNSQFYLLNCSDDVEKSKFENPQYLSDYYVRDASFFRMDYISLGYSFKRILFKKIDVNLAATLQNVFVLTHYNGQDPENFSGVEYAQYPRPRMASFKIQMAF